MVDFHVFTVPAEQPSVQSGILDTVDDLDGSRQNLLEVLGKGGFSKQAPLCGSDRVSTPQPDYFA